MQRDAWVFVGVRLLGLYYIASAFTGLPALFSFDLAPQRARSLVASAVLHLVVQFLVGVVLCMGAPAILRWLQSKDSRLVGPGRSAE